MSLTFHRQVHRLAILALALTMPLDRWSQAQNDRPSPSRPESQLAAAHAAGQDPQDAQQNNGQPPAEHNGTDAPKQAPGSVGPVRKREPLPGKVTLAFNNAPVDDKIMSVIADATGKVVIPVNLQTLQTKKITLIHDEPVERAQALDLVLKALQLNGVGISETEDVIVLDDLANLAKKQVPVYSANDDIMELTNRGNFIVKVYRLKEAPADTVGEKLEDVRPDYATLSIDINSNQIILYGDVGLAQHFQRLINELDRNFIKVQTETFRLAYADATAVSQQIWDLFDNSGATGQPNVPGQPRPPRNVPRGANRAQTPGTVQPTAAGLSTPGPIVEMRVSVNVQQNAVTVSAEPAKIEAIAHLIHEVWDRPRPTETFRVYVLENTDPIKMRDLITSLLGSGGSTSRTSANRAGQAGRPGAAPQVAGGAGGGAAISEVIGDIYRVEAYPDRNSIVVMSKTKEALDYLDAFIKANDLPSTVGLPQVVELKHANAVSLADELNVLLAEAGTGGSLERPGTGLNAEGPGSFTTNGTNGSSTGTTGTTGRSGTGGAGGNGTIEFPWQRGRARDDQSDPSSLIGKVRIVPIVRQNALAVLAPVSQRQAVVDLIREFDRPGRQVMISAIIAEVQLTNDFAMGLRLSSSAISPSNPDNAIAGGVSLTGTTNNIASKLFDTSVLDVNVDINVLLQALSQKTNVRIIQEPRVFTADNEEAAFFDGQQIPFITNSVVNSQVNGGVTQSFDYKNVGVLLNVRPRITVQRDVDMEIRLELSAVVPGQTILGGAVLDLRRTTTKVIVKNAQTIVLSGLLKDLDSKVTRGLPLLSDIPLIGELFKSHESTRSASELVAFITPIVVDNPSENDENFNKQERATLRNLSIPAKDQNKDLQQQRQRIREKILAPKTPEGEPIPEALPDPAYQHRPPTEQRRPAPAPPTSAKSTPPPPSEPPAGEPVAPTVDIDELNEKPPT